MNTPTPSDSLKVKGESSSSATEQTSGEPLTDTQHSAGWRTFDTAPKRSLIVAADFVREYWAVGCINAQGEFEQTTKEGRPTGTGFYPTHWMPLWPAPPLTFAQVAEISRRCGDA